jgi:hypothetical protein
MKIVEPILKKGNVYIAAWCSQLLVATFIAHANKRKVTVQSDKGIDHLLTLLRGKVNRNAAFIKKANQKYPYPLSLVHNCEKVRILEKSYTKFSYNDKGYRVSIKQINVPELDAIPGIYWRKAYGLTLEEAFVAAVATIPELQL